MPAVYGILHITWLVSDIERARGFYEDVLGLRPDESRPDLGYAGAWYTLGSGQQIHLMQLPNPDSVTGRPAHGGRDRHVALAVGDLENLVAALERAGVPFTRSSSGRPALFTRDPDGNTFEFIGGMQGASHAPRGWCALRCAEGKDGRMLQWALKLKEAKGFNVAAVALANKMVSVTWAMLAHGRHYQAQWNDSREVMAH